MTKIIELKVPSDNASNEDNGTDHAPDDNNEAVQEREENFNDTHLEQEICKLNTSYNPIESSCSCPYYSLGF